MKIKSVWLSLMLSGALLSGCASTSVEPQGASPQLLLATPRQADPQLEVSVAKITELLHSGKMEAEEQSKLFYERAIRYDALGLRTLARLDFNQAMHLQPAEANVFNFMGIYATQASDFDKAYESFDAVLELDPEYNYAYLNRGIASYYGGRTDLAVIDFTTFYQLDKQDAYRVVWLYLAEQALDPVSAKSNLQQRVALLDSNDWATGLAKFYLGEIDEGQLLQSARRGLTKKGEMGERMCEAYFYLGKQARIDGEPSRAINLYKLALATNVYEFVEHRYALLEMRQIAEDAIEEARKAQESMPQEPQA
ncbi:lipoprotein NlpI [Ferrimonas lipolytica]|uniref:Lipoprotein NlpI n=1 Tax=Ferrimonas lipolytica TaxID=2724191 RepID=A0A6H1UDQ5_9GAMM|nr:lipoprotein NlpI [Ferrimonas lipolytica]QIZ75932.1 lipoprotein NlpI [Ferrimonas lipolytica]